MIVHSETKGRKILAMVVAALSFGSGLLAADVPAYVVNVKDFGAVGDGVHDDTLALQKAADFVSKATLKNGGVDYMLKRYFTVMVDGPVKQVYFPQGTYRVTGPVLFSGSAYVRGDQATIVNDTKDKDTFYFHKCVRLDVEDLAFRGGRYQVRQWTQNRDAASTRFTNCVFEQANARGIFLDTPRVVDAKGGAKFVSPYEITRDADGRVSLKDVEYSQTYNFSNIVNIERCHFTNNQCSIHIVYADGLNIEHCVFDDDCSHSEGPIVHVGVTDSFKDLVFNVTGDTSKRTAIEYRGGDITIAGMRVNAPQGLVAFRTMRSIPKHKDNQNGYSVTLRDLDLDTGDSPVMSIGTAYPPDKMTFSRIRRVRAGSKKKPLLRFETEMTRDVLAKILPFHRHDFRGIEGLWGWSVSDVDEKAFDLRMPEFYKKLRRQPGPGLTRRLTFTEKEIPTGACFTDASIGSDSCKEKGDDTERVAALFTRARAAGGGVVLLPPRWIRLSRTIEIPPNVRVTSNGRAILRALNADLTLFRTVGDPDAFFENLAFWDGLHAVDCTASAGRLRFLNCYFYDQVGASIMAVANGASRLRVEVRGGVQYTPHVYDGNAAPALFDDCWFSLASELCKEDWKKVTEKSQSGIVNRAGGRLHMYDILGVPCVYWNVPTGNFYKWAGNPKAHPELMGDFRWVDNYGDFLSICVRYGGEWAGLTPVYSYGENARTVMSGDRIGGLSYGFLKGRLSTIVSDCPKTKALIEDAHYCSTAPKPCTVVWKKSDGTLEPAQGWTSVNCAPFAEPPSSTEDLWVSNHTDFPARTVVWNVVGKTNFVYDAGGNVLTVREPAIALHLKDCKNVTFRNLTIDWERPVLTEGIVEAFRNGETIVRIDRAKYPMVVEDGVPYMIGPGRKDTIRSVRYFSGKTHEPVLLTADTGFSSVKARELPDGTIAFAKDLSETGVGIVPGDILIFRPVERPYPAIFVEDSCNVTFEDVVVHDAYGMALVAQMSENVTFRGTGIAADRTAGVFPRAGALVSTHADATHFSNVAGQVLVENCWFEGMMDDAINVHSTCAQITNVVARNVIRCQFRHHESVGFTLFHPGNRMRYLRGRTNEDGPVVRVKAVKRLSDLAFELTLEEPVPVGFGVGDTVENADYQCAATFRGNMIRNNRARGALFTTPGKVICDSNRFERCCGSGVVMTSDAFYWFESGHCRDVQIVGNVFSNCLSAGYGVHGSAFGVISINPEIYDVSAQKDYCHRNLRIEDNTIFTHDASLLFANSVRDLVWRHNTVHYNNDLPSWQKPKFVLKRTENVVIEPDASVEAEKHPWSHLNFKDDPQDFRFAIVPDRTGGDYRGAFTNALNCCNLMHPAFVMTVGDLVNGHADEAGTRRMQDELTNFVSRVEAPFFYMIGNHDICVNTNPDKPNDQTKYQMTTRVWKDYFGERTYYSFMYKGCLFIILNGQEGRLDWAHIRNDVTPEQYAWARQTLAEHKDARWTFLFMHQPDIWGSKEWAAFERDALLSRKYTVFAGDWHNYFHMRRYDRDYYVLSVAGGCSSMAYRNKEDPSKLYGLEYGEFDHITWVTMTDQGPKVVNLKLDGILPGDFLNATNTKDEHHRRTRDYDIPSRRNSR